MLCFTVSRSELLLNTNAGAATSVMSHTRSLPLAGNLSAGKSRLASAISPLLFRFVLYYTAYAIIVADKLLTRGI
jgi:hypothetical protein